MTQAQPLLRRAMLLLAPLLLAACAAAPPAPRLPATATPGAPGAAFWSGRISLQVADRPEQSFAALFELRGSPAQGELSLSTPVGSTLAQLQWAPGVASLRQGSARREFASIDALVREATGTAVPVEALFDWLDGRATPVAGWSSDLSQLAQGRLRAVRDTPQPAAELRLALDR